MGEHNLPRDPPAPRKIANINIVPMDPTNLYRKDTYTDGKTGSVSENLPIIFDADGNMQVDPVRVPYYEGQTYINTPAGTQPLSFVIPGAKTLQEAVELWAQACGGTIQELQSRAIQSQIASGGGMMNGRPLEIPPPSRKRS